MQPEPPTGQPPPEPAEADPAAPHAPAEPVAAPPPAATQVSPAWPPVPPAQPAAQWPPAAPIATRVGPPRPGAITAAAIVLILFGAILGLIGLLVMLGGAMFSAIKDSPELAGQLGAVDDSFGAFILVLGAVLAAWGALQVVSAIYVLSRRTWARIAAMILAILGALIGLASIIPGENGATPTGIVISLAIVGGHVFAIWALASQGRWFSAVEPGAPAV